MATFGKADLEGTLGADPCVRREEQQAACRQRVARAGHHHGQRVFIEAHEQFGARSHQFPDVFRTGAHYIQVETGTEAVFAAEDEDSLCFLLGAVEGGMQRADHGVAKRVGATVIHGEDGDAVFDGGGEMLSGQIGPLICAVCAASGGSLERWGSRATGPGRKYQPKGRERAVARSGISVNWMPTPSSVWRTTRPVIRPIETPVPIGGRFSTAT